MTAFNAVFVKEEDGSLDIKVELIEEKDPSTSQSTKGKKEHRGIG